MREFSLCELWNALSGVGIAAESRLVAAAGQIAGAQQQFWGFGMLSDNGDHRGGLEPETTWNLILPSRQFQTHSPGA